MKQIFYLSGENPKIAEVELVNSLGIKKYKVYERTIIAENRRNFTMLAYTKKLMGFFLRQTLRIWKSQWKDSTGIQPAKKISP